MISPSTSFGGCFEVAAVAMGMLVRCYAACESRANTCVEVSRCERSAAVLAVIQVRATETSSLGIGGSSANVIGRVTGIQAASVLAEDSEVGDAELLHGELQRGGENPETVLYA